MSVRHIYVCNIFIWIFPTRSENAIAFLFFIKDNTIFMYSLQLGCDYEFMATMRMSPDVYRVLKRLVYPIIYRQDTNYRVSITPTERLSIPSSR